MTLLFFACAGSPTPPDSTDSVSLDSEDTSSLDTQDTGPVLEAGTVTGQVLGPDGDPATATVTLCHGSCKFADTDSEGRFAFDGVVPQNYAIHVGTFGAEPDWADLLVFVDVAEGEQLALEAPLAMARVGERTLVESAGEVEVAEGLWLDADPAAVTLPFGTDTFELAGGAPASMPAGLPDGEVLALWYLSPFDATHEPGMGFRARNDWGLAPGTEVTLMAASYLDYAWQPAGTALVSDDGEELSGGDVRHVSTLLVMAP